MKYFQFLAAFACLAPSTAHALRCPPLLDSTTQIACIHTCSNRFCGYSVDLAGRRYQGNFVSYIGRDPQYPIKDDRSDAYEVPILTDGSSLYVRVDEEPDWSIVVRAQNGLDGPSQEYGGHANEDVRIDNLSHGNYYVNIGHPPKSAGVDVANYNAIIFVLPTIQEDVAGDNPEKSRYVGEMSKSKPNLEIKDYLQSFSDRKSNGTAGSLLVRDLGDWFKIRTTFRGKLKAILKTATFPDDGIGTFQLGYSVNGGDPGDMPDSGLVLDPGEHYIFYRLRPLGAFGEFSVKYSIALDLAPLP